MNGLVNKYSLLQRAIHRVIEDNRCRGADEVIDNLDLLEQAEEEFGSELYDFLLEYQEIKGEFGEE